MYPVSPAFGFAPSPVAPSSRISPPAPVAMVDDAPVLFDIVAHSYAEQRLTIKNREYVTPNEAQLERIRGRLVDQIEAGQSRGGETVMAELKAKLLSRLS